MTSSVEHGLRGHTIADQTLIPAVTGWVTLGEHEQRGQLVESPARQVSVHESAGSELGPEQGSTRFQLLQQ